MAVWVNRRDLRKYILGYSAAFKRNTSDAYIEIRLDLKKIVLSPKK